MPFGFFKCKENVDFKARLERKMCVAREAPEPIFDLSDCNLKSVPSGVYSLCKVLRKEALFLQCNMITTLSSGGVLRDLSLIKVLDVSSNKISRLPDDISCLEQLEDLNLSQNLLTSLPNTIGQLKCLKKLNLCHNKLKMLPKTLGRCRGLLSIDLRENQQLLRLPIEFGGLKNLCELKTDSGLKFPDASVILQGAAATIAFLQSECGDTLTEEFEDDESVRDLKVETDYFVLQEKLKMIEQRKEEEKNQRLAWEKSLIEENIKEGMLVQEKMKDDRRKLVDDITILQNGVEEELQRIQKLKDVERSQLIIQCLETEERMNSKVGLCLENARKFQNSIAQMTDRERALEDELLFEIHKKNQHVEKSQAMNELVEEEFLKAQKFQKYDEKRQETAKNWIHEESDISMKLANLVESAKKDAQNLSDALLIDEELQKAAVASLMLQSDARSWNLAQQVSSIQAQLSELTRIEIERKKAEQKDRVVELSVGRVALSELLIDLFAQQQERREQLLAALKRLEGVRGNDESFWLEQYQRLLDSNSRQLVKNLKTMDNALQMEMANHGVAHLLPILADKISSRIDVVSITDQDLLEAGVVDDEDRALLLKAFKSYLDSYRPLPSAPELQEEASAPPLSPTDKIFASTFNECVVCMENTVDAIFLPCGHMCCCLSCARLENCPMCRVDISRVLQTKIYE